MSQLPPADAAWHSMCAKHHEEMGAFNRKVEANKKEFDRRVDAERYGLVTRHAQQKSDFLKQASNTAGRTAPAPQSVAPNTQTITSKMSATPGFSHQKPLPTPGPPRKQPPSSQPPPISFKAYDDQRRQSQTKVPVSAPLQNSVQQPKPSPNARQAQPTHKKQVPTVPTGGLHPSKPIQAPPGNTGPRSRSTQGQECETIDLCSDDDDVLVETTKTAYLKSTVVHPLDWPGISTATLQLFGERPALIKREKAAAGQLSQVQPRTPKPATDLSSTHPPQGNQARGSTALNALSSTISQRAATAITTQQQTQAPPQPAPNKLPLPFDEKTTVPTTLLNQQSQDLSNLTVNHATLLINKDSSTLQQQKQDGGFVDHALENEQAKGLAPNLTETFDRKDSDDDVDMEDIPLALLDMKAALRKLGVTTSKSNSTEIDSSAPAVASFSKTVVDVQRTHLPSPSLSVASTPTTYPDSETTALLNSFKKPVLPTLGGSRSTEKHTLLSRASSHTLAVTPVPEGLLQSQRGISVTSCVSHLSRSSKKRKEVSLSDDEQSDYTPSESSPFAERKKSTISFGSPRKTSKAAVRAGQRVSPPPSASPMTPVGKQTNGFGFGTVTQNTPAMAPCTPRTPTQGSPNKKLKVSSLTLGKRSAAHKAREKIQQTCEALEQSHTENQIHQAFAREARRGGTTTADLGRCLRSMSITPVPMDTQFNGTPRNSATAGASPKAASTATEAEDTGLHTKGKLLENKSSKHRLAARDRNISNLIGDNSDGDYEDDLDISEFNYINGIIIQAGQEGRLTEAQTKAVTPGSG